MTGYMIYEKNDAQKNKMYVEMHKEAFADFGVDIKLVLTDKIYKEHKRIKCIQIYFSSFVFLYVYFFLRY